MLPAVIMVIYGNEPHSHKGENLVEIITQFYVIPCKPGHILYQNTTNFTLLYLF